jgi:pimeloyl-ACP methyl ester carboxylesterase
MERRLRVGGQELVCVDEGPADGEVLLLVMGLGLQLTAWPQGLIERWTARGFRVIRYDHRDIGLSSSQDHLPTPPLLWSALKHALHLPLRAPYTLAELADDAAALLRQLGIRGPRCSVCRWAAWWRSIWRGAIRSSSASCICG